MGIKVERSATTYKILRFSERGGPIVLRVGLSLDAARQHCRDPETSSRTASKAEGLEYTRVHGRWFDGYEEEK